MSSLFGVPGLERENVGFPSGTTVRDLITSPGIRGIQSFQKEARAKKPSTEEQEAIELRRRIGARGGFQSTLLAGKSATARRNVFKKNLGGTSR